MEKDNQLAVINQLANSTITAEIIESSDFAKQYELLISLNHYLSDLKANIDLSIKNLIKDQYYETGENSIISSNVKYTYVPGTTRETFNSKAFKADNPELYKQYVKISPVSDSLKTFKIKTTENSEGEGSK